MNKPARVQPEPPNIGNLGGLLKPQKPAAPRSARSDAATPAMPSDASLRASEPGAGEMTRSTSTAATAERGNGGGRRANRPAPASKQADDTIRTRFSFQLPGGVAARFDEECRRSEGTIADLIFDAIEAVGTDHLKARISELNAPRRGELFTRDSSGDRRGDRVKRDAYTSKANLTALEEVRVECGAKDRTQLIETAVALYLAQRHTAADSSR